MRLPTKQQFGYIGIIAFPILYIVVTFITSNPDWLIRALGPFGILLFIPVWITFLYFGQIGALVTTVLITTIIGFLLGRLVGWVIHKYLV